jgi:hypothetical protein
MKRRTQEEWRALFAAQAGSGQTAAAFCLERGVCPKYFSLRRRQLLGRASPRTALAGFVPVALPRLAEAPMLEVRLVTGLQLRVPAGVSAPWLAEFVRALQA